MEELWPTIDREKVKPGDALYDSKGKFYLVTKVDSELRDAHTGKAYIVSIIHVENEYGGEICGTPQMFQRRKFSHKKPSTRQQATAYDRNKVEIKEGDTVYTLFNKNDDRPLTVSAIDDSVLPPQVECVTAAGTIITYADFWITHEKPDTWERLERDIMDFSRNDMICNYYGVDDKDCINCRLGDGVNCWSDAVIDILNRAKALAGVKDERK